MSISIKNHKIEDIIFKSSPNIGSTFASNLPDALIIHFTGGSSATSSVSWLCNPSAKASAHVVVGRDGVITQLVPFDTIAWHAGKSSYGARNGYNQYSIGIEIDNPGRLHKTESGAFLSSFGRSYPAEQVITAIHRNEEKPSYWLAYSEQQLEAVFELCTALCSTYQIKEILGHEEIAPGRKDDPGPAFPLDKLRQRLIVGRNGNEAADSAELLVSRDTKPARGMVIADKLNFRSLPSKDATKLSQPFTRGTLLDIVNNEEGWYQVRSGEKLGWVKAEFIKLA